MTEMFIEQIKQKTNYELEQIIHKRNEYNPDFIQLVIEEMKTRNINIDKFEFLENTKSRASSNAQKILKENANSDLISGGIICLVGTIATIADTGYIWWGAILFGGIRFLRGLSKQ